MVNYRFRTQFLTFSLSELGVFHFPFLDYVLDLVKSAEVENPTSELVKSAGTIIKYMKSAEVEIPTSKLVK
jgi:hypothetical protein